MRGAQRQGAGAGGAVPARRHVGEAADVLRASAAFWKQPCSPEPAARGLPRAAMLLSGRGRKRAAPYLDAFPRERGFSTGRTSSEVLAKVSRNRASPSALPTRSAGG